MHRRRRAAPARREDWCISGCAAARGRRRPARYSAEDNARRALRRADKRGLRATRPKRSIGAARATERPVRRADPPARGARLLPATPRRRSRISGRPGSAADRKRAEPRRLTRANRKPRLLRRSMPSRRLAGDEQQSRRSCRCRNTEQRIAGAAGEPAPGERAIPGPMGSEIAISGQFGSAAAHPINQAVEREGHRLDRFRLQIEPVRQRPARRLRPTS